MVNHCEKVADEDAAAFVGRQSDMAVRSKFGWCRPNRDKGEVERFVRDQYTAWVEVKGGYGQWLSVRSVLIVELYLCIPGRVKVGKYMVAREQQLGGNH